MLTPRIDCYRREGKTPLEAGKIPQLGDRRTCPFGGNQED